MVDSNHTSHLLISTHAMTRKKCSSVHNPNLTYPKLIHVQDFYYIFARRILHWSYISATLHPSLYIYISRYKNVAVCIMKDTSSENAIVKITVVQKCSMYAYRHV